MKYIIGYTRENPDAAPQAGVTVTVVDPVTNLPVAAGGVQNCAPTTLTSDSNGRYAWTTELSPGPIRLEADFGGSVKRIRYGEETMQAHDAFLTDFHDQLALFTDGVVQGYGDALGVTASPSALQVTVGTGGALLWAHWWALDTTRTLTIAPNTTLGERRDLVVLQQHVGGSYQGRQNLVVIAGTVSAVDPAYNLDPDVLELPIARVTTAQNASVSTVTDVRTYALLRGTHPIGTADLVDGAVTLAKLAGNSVNASKIVAATITATQLAANAVTTPKLTDLAVTTSKLADQAVTGAKIANATITGTDIANATINSQHIFGGAVGTAQVADNAITPAKLDRAYLTSLHPRIDDFAQIGARTLSGSVSGQSPVTINFVAGVIYDGHVTWTFRGFASSSATQPVDGAFTTTVAGITVTQPVIQYDAGVDEPVIVRQNYTTAGGASLDISWGFTWTDGVTLSISGASLVEWDFQPRS